MHTADLTSPSAPIRLSAPPHQPPPLRLGEAITSRNPAFVQLLGLCPLLAVSSTTANALGLALATLLVLVGSNTLISALRAFLPAPARLPAQMLIIAGFTTAAMLIMQAFAFDVYQRIALFLQIIVTNCIILARAEQVASRTPVPWAAWDGLVTGIGFGLALVGLGMVREALGHGTLFAGLDQLFGPNASSWRVDLGSNRLLLASMPPGAFIVTGLVIALLAALGRRGAEPQKALDGEVE